MRGLTDMPLCDIIIRSKDGREHAVKAATSILESCDRDQIRLILVEDGSGPAGRSDDLGCWDVVVRTAKSMGAVSATNFGLSVATNFHDSEYIIVADNDIEVPAGDRTWLARMIREVEESPTCGAVGATTNFANPPQHVLSCGPTYTADWQDQKQGSGGVKENPEAPWFVSFFVMLRKKVVRELGLWDPRYDPGNYEDTDYSMLMREAGWEIRVARSVYIHHHGHKTFGDKLAELLTTNQRKFVDKWGPGRLGDRGMLPPQVVSEIYRLRSRPG